MNPFLLLATLVSAVTATLPLAFTLFSLLITFVSQDDTLWLGWPKIFRCLIVSSGGWACLYGLLCITGEI